MSKILNIKDDWFFLFIEKLLDGVDVEWKVLGDKIIGKFICGGGFQKKNFIEFGVGCIYYG